MQPMVSAGHGTWHGHCHSTGLPHVPGQQPCTKPWWRQCNCYLAGHFQHRVSGPGCPGSCAARQKILLDILKEDAGLQQGCLELPEGSFWPEETAALFAINQVPPKYGSTREGYKKWIHAAHAGRNGDGVPP